MGVIRNSLQKSSVFLAIYASMFIFLMYTCAYAFRKPFTVGLYEGETLFGFDAKVIYVLAEIIGYACSKFIGVRILPSMKPNQRTWYAIGLMSISEIALLGFATLPPYLKIIAICISGLPLGMIWGILFSFIEGRRISELINVGLSVALIVSSGIVKTFGQFVMNTFNTTEYWMPVITGLLCYPVMLIGAYMLNQIPEPDEKDKEARSERLPMNKKEQKDFFKRFTGGIISLVVFYGALTVFRELRDSFAADIWKELNINDSLIFTKTEVPIAFLVLFLMGLIVFVKSNRLARNIIYVIASLGCIVLMLSTWIYAQGGISVVTWMIISGLGMYMGYIPFTYLIERLIASIKVTSTAVFLIYLADSAGYIGTTAVFLMRNFAAINISWIHMIVNTAYYVGIISLFCIFFTFWYFRKQIVKITYSDLIENDNK